VEDDGSLRNPHNAHYTMLARGGVPGFVLWILVQASWAFGIVGGYLRSRRLHQRRWNGLFLFLFAYWAAFMINAAFDVFLEGPMGGIWFWTVYGVGLAAMWLYRHRPQVLRPDALPTALSGHG
jgi:O-antigen ligase